MVMFKKTEKQLEIESQIENELDRLGWLCTDQSPCLFCVDFRPNSPLGWVRVYDDYTSYEGPWEDILEALKEVEPEDEYASGLENFDDNAPTDTQNWPAELFETKQIKDGTCNDNPWTVIKIQTNAGVKYAAGPHGVSNCALSDAFEYGHLFDSEEEATESFQPEDDDCTDDCEITIKVYTKPGTKATKIGEAYASYDGVSWRDSIDNINSDGTGIVFLDCEESDIAEFVNEQLELDERVESYETIN